MRDVFVHAGSEGSGEQPGVVPPSEPGIAELAVRGVHLRRFEGFSEPRGSLAVGDMPSDGIPFTPRRWFVVHHVADREIRGEHAHRTCHQLLVCVHGAMRIAVDDGERRAETELADPTVGIYIPPLIWASQFQYEPDAVLLVLASHPYDPADYVREYSDFLELVGKAG